MEFIPSVKQRIEIVNTELTEQNADKQVLQNILAELETAIRDEKRMLEEAKLNIRIFT